MTDPAEPAALPEDEDARAGRRPRGRPRASSRRRRRSRPGPRRLQVPEGEIVRRVDRFVADRTGLSRSYVQKLISEGLLVDDQGRRLRANSEVRGGAVTLEVPPAEIPYHLEPDPTIEIDVVYEDDDLLIVNKPSGLVVHPAPGHWRGTLVNALMARGDHYGGIAGRRPAGHRPPPGPRHVRPADRRPQRRRPGSVMAQLKARRVRKTYLALAQGSVSAAVGRIEAPDRARPQGSQADGRRPRRPAGDDRATASASGSRDWTLLELDLVTGRTHQIRVHLAALGHPVAGDPVYGTGTSRKGPDGLERLFLHAWRLELVSPIVGEAGPGGGAAPGCARVGAGGPAGGRGPRPGGGRREAAHDRTGGPARRAGGAARDHQRAVRGGQGHDHRRAARRARASPTTTTS